MRRAILHLGFHKTGTTFLQMATKRWVRSLPSAQAPIFYSSQHMPDSGWLRVRSVAGWRLRNRISHATLEPLPESYTAVCDKLGRLGLLREFHALRRHFARAEPVLIHSDENSIGGTFGHSGYGQRKDWWLYAFWRFCPGREMPWPFYPNGDWLCATYAAAALASYDEVHLVLSLRRFDEMIISSLKDAVRSSNPLPPLDLFSRVVSDLGIRCRLLVERISQLEFVRNVHLLDYELLRRSPHEYFTHFSRLAGTDVVQVPSQIRKVNASPDDCATLDRLVERGALTYKRRMELEDVPALLGHDVLDPLANHYAVWRKYLMTARSPNDKFRYYC